MFAIKISTTIGSAEFKFPYPDVSTFIRSRYKRGIYACKRVNAKIPARIPITFHLYLQLCRQNIFSVSLVSLYIKSQCKKLSHISRGFSITEFSSAKEVR